MLFDKKITYYYDGKQRILNVVPNKLSIITSNKEVLNRIANFSPMNTIHRLLSHKNAYAVYFEKDDAEYLFKYLDSANLKVDNIYPYFYRNDNQEVYGQPFTEELYIKFFTVAGECLIKLRDSITSQDKVLKSLLEKKPFTLAEWIKFDKLKNREFAQDVFVLKYTGNDTYEYFESINNLAEHPSVDYAHPNFINSIQMQNPAVWGNNPYFSSQWAINNSAFINGITPQNDINLQNAMSVIANQNITIAPVNVAIIDDGIDVQHTELSNKITVDYDATRRRNNGNPLATNHHGTSLAGILSANDVNNLGIVGVNSVANIQNIRISYTLNNNRYSTNDITVAGIQHAIDNQAKVINISWSDVENDAVRKAIQAAVSANIVVCCAAGNFVNNNAAQKVVKFPALLPEVISVGASSLNDGVIRFVNGSTFGSCYNGRVDVYAPGEKIYTTANQNNFNQSFKGTSAATAYISGVVSLLLGIKPHLTPAEIKSIISAGDDLTTDAHGNPISAGHPQKVNVLKAVNQVLNTIP